MAQLVQPQLRPAPTAAARVAIAALLLGGLVGGAIGIRVAPLAQSAPAIEQPAPVVAPADAARPRTDTPLVNRRHWGGK